MNSFGGRWTEEKIEAFMEYVNAFLVIMNKYPQFKLLYFDGFAGSGVITPDAKRRFPPVSETRQLIQGVATHVLSISQPKTFDVYCFIEKDAENAENLRKLVNRDFSAKNVQVVLGDCNEKLVVLSNFLRRPREKPFRALLFIDPYGMQVSWDTIISLKGLQVDMWILVPTGVAVGRLLKRNGVINPAWMRRLTDFLGMSEADVMSHFYTHETYDTQLGTRSFYRKKTNATAKIGQLFMDRIASANIFRYVSEPMLLKNSRNVVLYHFIFCTNNLAALNIANHITSKRR